MSKYDDIINLPHHVSTNRPRMSMIDRAAQFAPFAALNGHSEAIEETARLTDRRIELSSDRQAELSTLLNQAIAHNRQIAITHFVPDARKSGGSYKITVGTVKKIDEPTETLVLHNGLTVALPDIYAISECR